MKYIRKSETSPQYLIDWEVENQSLLVGKNGPDQWDKFHGSEAKTKLQEQLAIEQGYICAYCNQSIHVGNPYDNERIRIEHLKPKSHPAYITEVFNYTNLVGSCFGGEKYPTPRELHCDPKKGNQILHPDIFPTNPDCENQLWIEFTPDGDGVILKGKSTEIDDSVEDVLNLNHPKLQVLRKKALEAWDFPTITPEEALGIIEIYQQRDEQGKFRPFSGVIITYITQMYLFY